jgi:arogenate/prephenate dehydratase
LRSSDGNAVPAAFRYASHRTSTKSGVSLGAVAAKSAAGATDNERVDPTVNPKNGIRVAYQGMPGAYSEAAAFAAYPHCEPCPCPQFENAFEATEQWTCDRAVLPFENSLGGSIHRNYDLILTHRLHVVGEVYFKVNHCLLALPGQKMGDITRAMSHPQALAQCDGYLTNLNGGVVKEAVDDTAGAAAHIAANKLMGAYFPITKSRLPDCPYETDTLFFISRRRRGGQRASRFAIRHGDLRQRHTG